MELEHYLEKKQALSELKALHTTTGFDGCQRIVEFPPGAVYTSRMDEPKVWYKPAWHDNAYLPTGALDFAELRQEVRACAAAATLHTSQG